MTTQYTTILKLALPVQGELSGTWGDVVNDNITQMVEQAVAGKAVINTWTGNSHTLTTADGTTSESRCAILELTDSGTALTGAGTVVCPTNTKLYIVDNNTAEIVTVKTSGGTGVAVPVGKTMLVYCDGTNVVEGVTHANSLSLGTSTVTADKILDEDNMASDSATAIATQQSIKAYVDSQVGTVDTLSEILAQGNTTGGTDLAVSAGDDITFTDSSKAIFGTDSDLQIYHDGSHSYVSDQGTGNLVLKGNNFRVYNAAEDKLMFAGNNGGISYMYYDGSVRIATSNTGVAVTGTVTADGLTIDGGNTLRLDAASTADFFTIVQGGTQAVLTADSDAAANMLFRTASAGVDTDRMQILSNGDIEIYEDTGTTPKFFWDASAESLTLSGTGGLDVTGTVTADGLTVDVNSGDVKFIDTGTAASDTPQILIGNGDTSARSGLIRNYNDATNFEIIASASTTADKNLVFRTVDNASESRLKIASNGDISFYEDTGTTPKLFWDASDESLILGSGVNTYAKLTIAEEGTSVGSTIRLIGTNTIAGGSQVSHITSYQPAGGFAGDAALGFKVRGGIDTFAEPSTVMTLLGGGSGGGKVGIGTDSPNAKVEISGAKNTSELRLSSTNNDSSWVAGDYIGKLSFYSADQSAAGAGIKGSIATVAVPPSGGTTNMVFSVATISSNEHEAMRIDASGNLLVGTTSTNPYTSATETGAVVRGDEGILGASRSGGASLRVNRVGTGGTENGDIAEFRSNGAVVGSITSDAGYLAIGKGDTGLLFQDGGDAIQPRDITGGANRDAAIDLGVSGGRFKDLYLSGGVVFGTTGGSVSSKTLDDYEEGTWTPVYAPSTGSFASITMDTAEAVYTKVGRMVTVSGIIRTDDIDVTGGSGIVLISGLPFPVSHWSAISLGRVQGFGGDMPDSGYGGGSAYNINLYYRATSNGATAALNVTDLADGAGDNSNYIFLEYTYQTTA